MIQGRHNDPIYVIVAHIGATIEERDHLGSEYERLSTTRARAETDIAVDVLVLGQGHSCGIDTADVSRTGRNRSVDQRGHVLLEMRSYQHFPH